MGCYTKRVFGGLIGLLIAIPAYAQICGDPDSTATAPDKHSFIHCDLNYRNTVVSCIDVNAKHPYGDPDANPPIVSDNVNPGTRAPCYKEPMPMLRTKMHTFADLSPYLYAYMLDTDGSAYNGIYATGNSGGPNKVFSMIGADSSGVSKRLASCIDQIRIDGKVMGQMSRLIDKAKFARMQMDNCSNQYILFSAFFPYQKANTKLINNPLISADPISLNTECQPIATFSELENEYNPTVYLQHAWNKTLTDPRHRKRNIPIPSIVRSVLNLIGSAANIDLSILDGVLGEPAYPDGVSLVNPLNTLPDGTNVNANVSAIKQQVRLSNIAAVPYEEILDPTHPFSPRWDYLFTDRDLSILTFYYQKKHGTDNDRDPNAVYCAGIKTDDNSNDDDQQKKDKMVQVDVLDFREKPFMEGLMRRVGYNTLCKAEASINQELKQAGSSGWDKGEHKIAIAAAFSFCFDPKDVGGFTICYAACEVANIFAFGSIDCNDLCNGSWTSDNQNGIAPLLGQIKSCWQCFYGDDYMGNKTDGSDKVDDVDKFPPCTTRYDGADLWMKDTTGWNNLMSIFSNPGKLVKILFGKGRLAGALNGFSAKANCVVPPIDFPAPTSKYNMTKLCSALRRPYTQINKLKMRYDYHTGDQNKDDAEKKNNVLTDGVMEGLRFKDYFSNHMPYPRMWDSGNSLTYSAGDRNFQPPLDTAGQYTTIVGVGRESAAEILGKNSAGHDLSTVHPDERCLVGGWGGTGLSGVFNLKGVALDTSDLGSATRTLISLPDPITSWTELKLYQARALRNLGLSCIPRYEKAFKQGGTEALTLLKSGGEWSRVVVSKCDKNGKNCSYLSGKSYLEQLAGGSVDRSTYSIVAQAKSEGWGNAWRGYIAASDADTNGKDDNPKTRFPNLGQSAGLFNTTLSPQIGLTPQAASVFVPDYNDMLVQDVSLDRAQKGDIILLPRGGDPLLNPQNANKDMNTLISKALNGEFNSGLPKLAFVVDVNLPKKDKKAGETDCTDTDDCFVKVLEADNGKWPDVCGTTDTWGMFQMRYYYKPGENGGAIKNAKDTYTKLGWTYDCVDTHLQRCEFSPWYISKLYRIRNDIRSGCSGGTDPTKPCQGQSN